MLKNITEMLVKQKLDELLQNEDCCKCNKCREDMVAYALNHLNPHYVSTTKGKLITKAKILSIEYDVAIVTELTKAIGVISQNPRH